MTKNNRTNLKTHQKNKQTDAGVDMDKRRKAKVTFQSNASPDQVAKWKKNPNRYDIVGVDAPPKTKATVKPTSKKPTTTKKAPAKKAPAKKANAPKNDRYVMTPAEERALEDYHRELRDQKALYLDMDSVNADLDDANWKEHDETYAYGGKKGRIRAWMDMKERDHRDIVSNDAYLYGYRKKSPQGKSTKKTALWRKRKKDTAKPKRSKWRR